MVGAQVQTAWLFELAHAVFGGHQADNCDWQEELQGSVFVAEGQDEWAHRVA